MTHRIRRIAAMFRAGQRGSAMILVLVFMAVAGLIVPPMLAYMSTGLKAGMVYEDKTRELYAAESGVNDGLWWVQYSEFSSLFSENYNIYDFSTPWSYTVNETLNNHPVIVTIRNIWIPQDIPVPSESQARNIVEDGKLLVLSGANSASEYEIKATFYPNEDDDLRVQTLGIWLPPGYHYVDGSSNLEELGEPYYPADVLVIPWRSGEAVIWQFSSLPFEQLGPDVESGLSIISTVTFSYTSEKPDAPMPTGVAWMNTSGVPDVPFTWDADVKVYRIEATAGSTSVNVYATRSEMRQLGAAVKGDYAAIGNVLETATGDVRYRDRLLLESTATIGEDDIPSDATIRDAWLYWSGWINDGHETEIWSDDADVFSSWTSVWEDNCSSLTSWQAVWEENCSDYDGWDDGDDWSVYNGDFRGHHSSSNSENDRYLTLTSPVNLQPYQGRTVTISWDQDESGYLESDDILRYSINGGSGWSSWQTAFQDDNPSSPHTYTIPDQYLTSTFQIRFYLNNFGASDEYAYIDNIEINADMGGWLAGDDWDVYNGDFRGHHVGDENDRYLEMASPVDLSGYAGQMVQLSWEQTEGSNMESSDGLDYYLFEGSDWDGPFRAFRHNDRDNPFTTIIPQEYLTADFKLKFYLVDMAGYGEYAYIDNIDISVSSGGWEAGGDWDIYDGEFRGHHYPANGEEDRRLTMTESVDLSPYQGSTVTVSWDQDESGYLGEADGLQFSLSKDGGASWSAWEDAFYNDNPPSPFSYVIPNSYLTSGFRLRFYLDQMSGTNQYAYIDDIRIVQNDMGVGQVVFNGVEITADEQQFKEDTWMGSPTGTYSYSCSYDATDLVKQMIEDDVNFDLELNGAGTYTVGHLPGPNPDYPGFIFNVYSAGNPGGPAVGTTGYPLAIPASEFSYYDIEAQYTYAAWSLIIIYTSPETEGHQLYLYDDFDFVENGSITLPVSGFLAPSGDTSGSRATFFIGEGDYNYSPDGARINGYSLSEDDTPVEGDDNPANNLWNSYSSALDNPSINGIDLDTFDISPYIEPGDTSAEIELYSDYEIFNTVYVLLSFRSDSEFGGVITYLIGD